jgi:hypothetical protein
MLALPSRARGSEDQPSNASESGDGHHEQTAA